MLPVWCGQWGQTCSEGAQHGAYGLDDKSQRRQACRDGDGNDAGKDRDTCRDGRAIRGQELRRQGHHLQRDDPEEPGTDHGIDGDDGKLGALSQAIGQKVHRHVTIGKARIREREEDDGREHEFGGFEGAWERMPEEITQQGI